MQYNTLYISLGIQCLTPNILKKNNLRKKSYPFDWIISNPYFVYKMLYLLLEEGMDVNKIVREHFFRNDQKCWRDRFEHYKFGKNGSAICNQLYNVVFPHDEYNEETINKYIRRFERLKKDILDTSHKIQFIYISQSSLKSGNFTINDKEVIENVYENMNNINMLLKKYNKNINIMLFDSIKNENINILSKEIKIQKISPKQRWPQLINEVNKILSEHIQLL
tara:strand:- start:30 stop:695 length:666 start_codon:yes stop_codon:yes gene_type:complete